MKLVLTGRTEFCGGLGACQGPITPEWEPPEVFHESFKSVFIRPDMLRVVPLLFLDRVFACDGRAVILHCR